MLTISVNPLLSRVNTSNEALGHVVMLWFRSTASFSKRFSDANSCRLFCPHFARCMLKYEQLSKCDLMSKCVSVVKCVIPFSSFTLHTLDPSAASFFSNPLVSNQVVLLGNWQGYVRLVF